jgi:hypothetical protein
MCDFYEPDAANACREPMADVVADKEAGNTCDYFRPGTSSQSAEDDEAAAARAKLDSLFGGEGGGTSGGSLADQAEALREKGESEADEARHKLEELFGKKED